MSPYYRLQLIKLDKDTAPDSDGGHAAVLMLAALKHGCKRVSTLARVTGVPYRDALPIARRLRGAGVWREDGKTHCQWDDPKLGGIAFWCDVAVATGMLARTRAASNGSAE